MYIRAWFADSTGVRAVGLTLLVLFIVVCGLHFAGAHHDADGDALALVDTLGVLSVFALVWAALTTSRVSRQCPAALQVMISSLQGCARWGLLPPLPAREIPLRR